jgi:uncharacterized protein YndB with AHSA1/START domain
MAHQLRREGIDFLDRAPIRVREEVRIAASPAEVWAAVADASLWAEWFPGMTVARSTTPEPVGVGSERYVEVQVLKANEELLAYDVDERYGFRIIDANLPVLAAFVELLELEAHDRTTLVVYRQGAELVAWARPLAPVARRQFAATVRKGLAGLDRWVTARADAT